MLNSRELNFQMRILADFCEATENEIAVDKMLLAVADVRPERVGFFPRPSKWISYGRRFPFFIFCLWFAIRWIWIFGGAYVFFFCQFFPTWLRAKQLGREFSETLIESGCVLALSSRVGDIVHGEHVKDLPCMWITMPWADLTRIPADAKCVDVFMLLNKSDIWSAYRNAIFATHILHRRKRTSPWILQSYTAFRWFAVRAAIDKLSGRLIMAEHFDRWAVLVDSSMQANKYRLNAYGQIQRRDLTLIQHGALGSLGEKNRSDAPLKLKLHRKLRAITQLYVYNPQEEHAFKADVLSAGCVRRGIKISYYTPGLELQVDHEYAGLKVLFVGHVLCEELHQHIFNSLAKEFEFKAYYKPHPTSPMSQIMNNSEWMVVNDVGYFPVVDLLISYPSTLIVEYSGKGVPAMVHPLNLTKKNSDDFVKYIGAKIKILQKLKVNTI